MYVNNSVKETLGDITDNKIGQGWDRSVTILEINVVSFRPLVFQNIENYPHGFIMTAKYIQLFLCFEMLVSNIIISL